MLNTIAVIRHVVLIACCCSYSHGSCSLPGVAVGGCAAAFAVLQLLPQSLPPLLWLLVPVLLLQLLRPAALPLLLLLP